MLILAQYIWRCEELVFVLKQKPNFLRVHTPDETKPLVITKVYKPSQQYNLFCVCVCVYNFVSLHEAKLSWNPWARLISTFRFVHGLC